MDADPRVSPLGRRWQCLRHVYFVLLPSGVFVQRGGRAAAARRGAGTEAYHMAH